MQLNMDQRKGKGLITINGYAEDEDLVFEILMMG